MIYVMIFAQQSLPHSSWEFYGLVVLVTANIISSVLAWLTSLRNREELKNVSNQVNGKMEQLLAVSKVADQAEGRQQERHHHETIQAEAVMSGRAILEAAEAKALAILEEAEAKAKERLEQALKGTTPRPGKTS